MYNKDNWYDGREYNPVTDRYSDEDIKKQDEFLMKENMKEKRKIKNVWRI